jgi:type II secretory pathway component GspD/PulD (secretin)
VALGLAGLLLGVGAVAVLRAGPAADVQVAQAQGRSGQARTALNAAIELQRRGDFEGAAPLFQEAFIRQEELTPQERNDLGRMMQDNQTALQLRKVAAQELALAEQDMKANRVSAATERLRKVATNQQYLAPADRQRFQQLDQQMRGGPGRPTIVQASATVPAGPGRPPQAGPMQAQQVMQQARMEMEHCNPDAAEALAHQAEHMGGSYPRPEDSPRGLLEQLTQLRNDPKYMLGASRAALERRDLGRAEQYAHEAERLSSAFTFPFWGDTPAKALKEIQAARAEGPPPPSQTGPAQVNKFVPDRMITGPTPQGNVQQVAANGPQGNPNAGPQLGDRGMPTPAMMNQQGPGPQAPPQAPARPDPETEAVKQLVAQGREALKHGDFPAARKIAEQAKAKKATGLHWSADNPDKLLSDIALAEGKAGGPPPNAVITKEQADSMLAQARVDLNDGKIEEAAQVGMRLKGNATLSWGLFRDSPDRLLQDVQKARVGRDREESVRLLADAREMFGHGDFDSAQRAAQKAENLHGPYSIWDMGDRPSKLLAEIDAARQKYNRPMLPDSSGPPQGPDTRLVSRQGPGPMPGPMPGPDGPPNPKWAMARGMLQEARQALNHGDLDRARLLADQVREAQPQLRLAFAPTEESPETIYRDLARVHRPNTGPVLAGQTGPQNNGPQRDPRLQANQDAARLAAAKEQARQMLAHAGKLQAEGRLIEARQLAVQAQLARVPWEPQGDNPDQFLQRLNAQARSRIEGQLRACDESIRYGGGDTVAKCQAAEKGLQQARELAQAFGQDMQSIDSKLAWVNQLRNVQMAPPDQPPAQIAQQRPVVPSDPIGPSIGLTPVGSNPGMGNPAPAPAPNIGLELLAKAKLELQKGELANARRLAEEAGATRYGVRDQAVDMLRCLEAEEENQRILQTNRTFEAVHAAFNRGDYAYASALASNIDPRKLGERQRARFGEMMMTPQMHLGHTTQTVAMGGSSQLAQGNPPAQSEPFGPTVGQLGQNDAPGKARASDQNGMSLLQATQAKNQVLFQQLRTDGLKAQNEAAEKFRTGQTDLALQILDEYLDRLTQTQLEPNQMAMLRRPIESRKSQFMLLKAQAELRDRTTVAKDQASQALGQIQLNEENKQKKVADLMKKYSVLLKEGKIEEAKRQAMLAAELDPDNAVITAAIEIAKRREAQGEYTKLKKDKEEYFRLVLNDADKAGGDATDAAIRGLDVGQVNYDRLHKRLGVSQQVLSRESEPDREIKSKLNVPVTMNWKNTPLSQVLDDIRVDRGINIHVEKFALEDLGVSLDRPVDIKVEQLALKSALSLMLRDLRLCYVVQDGVLKITTEKYARGGNQLRAYQVADLVIPVRDFGSLANRPMDNGLLGMTPVNPTNTLGYPSPIVPPYGVAGGDSVGAPMGTYTPGGGNTPFAGQPGSSGTNIQKRWADTQEGMLIKLITGTIRPETWADAGGPGTIDFHPLTMALVVNQTPDIQEQIADLLQALRRLQDQEVAVEVRFISIAEDFFERVGVNFNMNIRNEANTISYEPLLTSGAYRIPPYINKFIPDRFITGLTPAGSFTSDLNIPIQNNTFFQSVPPFGGYTGLPGYGGITFGLAFLSDIQLFLFLEAVSGDMRTNVMQAPKLTLFNGQTATLNVTDQQFFVTGTQLLPLQNGNITFQPQVQAQQFGVNLTLQAVISADRRFVRMSLNPNLTNLAPGPVQLFPVVVPIFPNAPASPSDPVTFTQFIQQPISQNISVATTVMVPDGGTALLGGLKRLSEGRNEFGPPIISKIPYLDRLFRNVAYGRSTESLMMMVTPRIIIQEEEEERATGYRSTPLLGTGG